MGDIHMYSMPRQAVKSVMTKGSQAALTLNSNMHSSFVALCFDMTAGHPM